MKINSLQVSDVKRVKAVSIEFNENGMTIIGGRNRQGKTSVISAIMYVLGGENYRPSNFKREGSEADGFIRLTFDDGIVCERRGSDARLTVVDPSGKKAGQALLNSFVSKFSIDLPKFINGSDREKAEILLDIIGLKDELTRLDEEEKTIYDERTLVNREADQKAKAAKEMQFYPDCPNEEVSITSLTAKLQDILASNAAIVAASKKLEQSKANLVSMISKKTRLESQKTNLKAQIAQQKENLLKQLKALDETFAQQDKILDQQIADNGKAITDLTTEITEAESISTKPNDTSAVEAEIAKCEDTNAKIRANKQRADAIEMANAKKKESDSLTEKINAIRQKRIALLDGANLPYPGLSVQNGTLYLNGKAWDCMSGAEQLTVGCAIASKINPECKFVLLDKLEQYDLETLNEFETWCKANDLQVIATRVSTGEECSVIIEDGYVQGQEDVVIDKTPITKTLRKAAKNAESEDTTSTTTTTSSDDEEIKFEIPPYGESSDNVEEDAMATAMRLLQEARDRRNGESNK